MNKVALIFNDIDCCIYCPLRGGIKCFGIYAANISGPRMRTAEELREVEKIQTQWMKGFNKDPYEKSELCPLKSVPEKKQEYSYEQTVNGIGAPEVNDFNRGYNKCIDELLGE